MNKELSKITDHWKETYSSQLTVKSPFKISDDFKRYAAMFTLGSSYLYIVNMHDFELEYVSDSVRQFLNKEAGEVEMKDLLQSVVPEEINEIRLKGELVSDFYTSFLNKEDVLDYKNMFSYRMKVDKQIRTMLYQAIPLSVSENGTPQHVLCIQTDVSHLKVASTKSVSFINMNGGKSYFNIDIVQGEFDPGICDAGEKNFSELLSRREKEIVSELARGRNAQDIARDLNLSPHTVRTHRKNMLQKSGCSNTAELVAKCLTGGVISPGVN